MSNTLTSPEMDVLLLCSRLRVDTNDQQKIKTVILSELDWSNLINLARYHLTLPLLVQNLFAACRESIPESYNLLFKSNYSDNVFRNIYLSNELLRLLVLFNENNIPVIPFKGPSLAFFAYGNTALRMFGDLDILIHKEDFPKVLELLNKNGYKNNSEAANSFYQNSYYSLVKDDEKICIDLQWGFAKEEFSFPINVDRVWKNSTKCVFEDEEIVQPHINDLLLILCGHGTKHCWCRLGWITDIDALLTNHKLDWDEALKHAKKLGGYRIMLLGFALAKNLLDSDIPEKVQRLINKEPNLRYLVNRVCDNLYKNEINHLAVHGSFGTINRNLFYIRARERMSDKISLYIALIKYVFGRILIPNKLDRAFIRLPKSFYLLYYFIRPIRLFKKVLGSDSN